MSHVSAPTRYRMFATTHFRFFLFRLAIARRVRGVALLVAMLYGVMALANVVSLSHDPFAYAGHGSVAALVDAQDHGHDHDHEEDGAAIASEAAGGGAGALHGHHAADHSHDKQDLSKPAILAAAPAAHVWQPWAPASLAPHPVFTFERPPRPIPIA